MSHFGHVEVSETRFRLRLLGHRQMEKGNHEALLSLTQNSGSGGQHGDAVVDDSVWTMGNQAGELLTYQPTGIMATP